MATTETEAGHEHIGEGSAEESMEDKPVTLPKAEELELVGGSTPDLKLEDDDDNAAPAEDQTPAQSREPEANSVHPDSSQSPSQDFETVTVLGDDGELSDAEKEVKMEEEYSLVGQYSSTEEKPARRDDMDTTSGPDKEKKHDDDIEVGSDSKDDCKTNREKSGSKVKISMSSELDEMMDIGTVDQVEQEAQMTDKKEDMFDRESSSSSAASNTGNDDPSAKSDLKLVKHSVPRGSKEKRTYVSQSTELSPSPPVIEVKDEPLDDEYEQALLSTSTKFLKDELENDDLKIGSVYSMPNAAETQTLPVVNPSSLHMSCSSCKKSLQKGQTAFQRKGSPALFCSTGCLATMPLAKAAPQNSPKTCHNCQMLIFHAQDVFMAPDGKGAVVDFCSQACLNAFEYKKTSANSRKTAGAATAATKTQPISSQPLCSMCTRHCISKHEVILGGTVHMLCSDTCFNRFRSVNNLSMAGCANCSSFCHSKTIMLKMEERSQTLCNMECLAQYKEKTRIMQPCTMCHTSRILSEMLDWKNSDDLVNLFCSSSCIMAFKVQTVSSSGARLNCDTCGKNTVPGYHLAMSDTSIRNFCTLPCVMTYQEKFKKSQKNMNVFTKLPMGSGPAQSPSSILPKQDGKGSQKLCCFQCFHIITFKPEIIQIKDKIVFLCSVDCSHEYKKANYVMSVCDYCKVEKITRDAKRVNNKECYFCSDGCKLLFRHDLSKKWGKHCHSCVYCHCISKRVVTAQYGGTTEEFCSEDCRSKYTMLFCHVAKCDTCGRKGKLKQSLPLLGEVKHFCDLGCLLQFCCFKAATQGEIIKPAISEATPVIANVISLANPTPGKSKSSERLAQKSIQSKNLGNLGMQTDTLKTAPNVASPKILKNKALMCRPLVQNKGVSCKVQTTDAGAQTDEAFNKVVILPVPVPVYVPVPMSMYSQCTPRPVGLPLPLPVPMFLPVGVNNAERLLETIKEIKQKIPSDPYEAELILMAEMVAEHDNNKEKTSKDRMEQTAGEGVEAPPLDGDRNNYNNDLDADDLASFLNNWEDSGSDGGIGQNAKNKLNSGSNFHRDLHSEPPPASPRPMDVEEDFTIETLERMSQMRAQQSKPTVPEPAGGRRRQAHRKAREKRGWKLKRSSKDVDVIPEKDTNQAAEVPKLRSKYGVDAWKRWIQWRQTQPNLETPRYGSRPIELKEDLLRCTTAELSYGLCCFIKEVKRPNGEPYSSDSLIYLCLGIQQYLFQNGRVENIFMDRFYTKFSTDFTNKLRDFQPSITASGYIHSRVEEEYLWDCKQLGAYSPIVLLNSLLFFCCKYFGFTTVEQHRQLSFAHVMRCTKTNADNTKTTLLRFYPPISVPEAESASDLEGVAAKRRKEEESKEDILEMVENTENPLRCPVRLYEFYLSKCSDSVKQRTNVFYLEPERCCVPNSPLWFSSNPLDDSTMDAMLVRILTVRELHLKRRENVGGTEDEDSLFIPEVEDDEEDEDEW